MPRVKSQRRNLSGFETLLSWDLRVHDWRVHAIHMIFVAQQAVLTRRTAVVTGLAQILFHRTEIGHEILRIALLVALQIGRTFFKDMAGETTALPGCQCADRSRPAWKCGVWMKLCKRPRLLSTESGEKFTTRPLPFISSMLWHFVHDP